MIFCGDRLWTNGVPIFRELRALLTIHGDQLEVIEGGARGADSMSREACLRLKVSVIEILADWATHGRAAGPIRNQRMLDMGPDLVVAFHKNIDQSKGTRDMVNRAKKAGVPVRVVTE